MIDKKGENDFEFIYAYLEIEFMHVLYFMFIQKRRRRILKVYTKRGRRFLERRNFDLSMFSHLVYVYIFA